MILFLLFVCFHDGFGFLNSVGFSIESKVSSSLYIPLSFQPFLYTFYPLRFFPIATRPSFPSIRPLTNLPQNPPLTPPLFPSPNSRAPIRHNRRPPLRRAHLRHLPGWSHRPPSSPRDPSPLLQSRGHLQRLGRDRPRLRPPLPVRARHSAALLRSPTRPGDPAAAPAVPALARRQRRFRAPASCPAGPAAQAGVGAQFHGQRGGNGETGRDGLRCRPQRLQHEDGRQPRRRAPASLSQIADRDRWPLVRDPAFARLGHSCGQGAYCVVVASCRQEGEVGPGRHGQGPE